MSSWQLASYMFFPDWSRLVVFMVCYGFGLKEEAVQVLQDALIKRCWGWIFVFEVLLDQHADPPGSVWKHLRPTVVGIMSSKVWDLTTCAHYGMLCQVNVRMEL